MECKESNQTNIHIKNFSCFEYENELFSPEHMTLQVGLEPTTYKLLYKIPRPMLSSIFIGLAQF